jgi:sugar-phosphatase
VANPTPNPSRSGPSGWGLPRPARWCSRTPWGGGGGPPHAAGTKAVALTTTTPAAELAPLADAVLESLAEVTVQVTGGALVVSRRGH